MCAIVTIPGPTHRFISILFVSQAHGIRVGTRSERWRLFSSDEIARNQRYINLQHICLQISLAFGLKKTEFSWRRKAAVSQHWCIMIKFAVICVSVLALLVFVDVDAKRGQGSGKVFGFFVTWCLSVLPRVIVSLLFCIPLYAPWAVIFLL